MTDAVSKSARPAGLTPSATVGPFFKYGLTPSGKYPWNDAFSNDLVTADAAGERVEIVGRVFDGDGVGILDAMLEIWQADASGRYNHPLQSGASSNASFKGHGRTDTDPQGNYAFRTVKPGPVAWPKGGTQAPHILVAVFARGMLKQVYTRIYFPGDAANGHDPVLALVPADRRETLMAKPDGPGRLRFDIHIQGPRETVFFDV